MPEMPRICSFVAARSKSICSRCLSPYFQRRYLRLSYVIHALSVPRQIHPYLPGRSLDCWNGYRPCGISSLAGLMRVDKIFGRGCSEFPVSVNYRYISELPSIESSESDRAVRTLCTMRFCGYPIHHYLSYFIHLS